MNEQYKIEIDKKKPKYTKEISFLKHNSLFLWINILSTIINLVENKC